MNVEAVALTPDSILANFKARTAAQTPAERAKSLEDDNAFKSKHSANAAQGQSTQAADQS
tara:strand:- start:285 stop:464 length:180 start_codon:yes stop_codon:yes gene_type:complete